MRFLPLILSLLIFTSPNSGLAQVGDSKEAQPALSAQELRHFADSLRQIMDLIADHYVRPISRERLAGAALKGLYEAAQAPVPPGLAERVHRAAIDDLELTRLLLRSRESLGNRESLRNQKDLRASLQGILEILDPYCALLSDEELEQVGNQSRGLQGFGLTFADYSGSGPLIVRDVVLGSPAQRADLRPGDRVTHLNGASVVGLPAGPVQQMAQTSIRLTVQRSSTNKPREVRLKAEMYRVDTVLGVTRNPDNTWDYWLDRDRRIAYIRLANLDSGTADDLSILLKHLESEQLQGLILDLRWCPGGLLNESRQVADCFLSPYGIGHLMFPLPGNWLALADLCTDPHNNNATVQYRDGRMDAWGPRQPEHFWTFPLIVLINGESSGGAELIAAVLQDQLRAVLQGQRTKGKGSVQTTLDFREGRYLVRVPNLGMKISNGILIRPSGKNLHRFAGLSSRDDWGVRPNPGYEYRISAALSQRLKDWWLMQSLRPGTSREILPLDNPENDPQQQAALDLMRTWAKPPLQ